MRFLKKVLHISSFKYVCTMGPEMTLGNIMRAKYRSSTPVVLHRFCLPCEVEGQLEVPMQYPSIHLAIAM